VAAQLRKQVAQVLDAIRSHPKRRRQILSVYASSFFGAVKETLRRQGRIVPLYMILADPADFGIPPVTEEVARQAREMNAEAVVWVEGFQSEKDISDVIYHVGISSPGMGVMGWVLKVKLGDGRVVFTRERPYCFDSPDKVKSLGEIISEMDKEG
jgi:ribosomal protein S8